MNNNLDKKTRLKLAFAISGIFVIVEVIGGLLANSLGKDIIIIIINIIMTITFL